MLSESLSEKNRKMRDQLEAFTGYTNWSESSVIRMVTSLVNEHLIRIGTSTNFLLSQSKIEQAGGTFLDNLAFQYGVIREAKQKASDFTNNVLLTASGLSGNFDIPAGTRVTGAGVVSGLYYVMQDDITLTIGSPSTYVSVIANDYGEIFNVGSNTLTQVKISPPVDVSLTCTNERPITNGRIQESDERLRFRVLSKISGSTPGTKNSVRSFLDASRSVVSYAIEEYNNSIVVTIQPQEIESGVASLTSISSNLDTLIPMGMVVDIALPTIISVDATADITLNTSSQKQISANSLKATITGVIKSKPMDIPLSISEIEQTLKQDPSVKSLTLSRFTGVVLSGSTLGKTTRIVTSNTSGEMGLTNGEHFMFVPGAITINVKS